MKQLRKLLKERGQRCIGCTDKSEFVKLVKDSLHLPILSALNTEKSSTDTKVKQQQNNKKKKRKTLMQEKRERALRKAAARGWANEPSGNGNIIHSYDGHFEELYLSKQKTQGGSSLIYFYAPWCSHCKVYKSKLVELSDRLSDDDTLSHIEIVAIDGDGSKEIAHKYKIKTFPTFMFFRNGIEDNEL